MNNSCELASLDLVDRQDQIAGCFRTVQNRERNSTAEVPTGSEQWVRFMVALAALLVICAGRLLAQVDTGIISGVVTDASVAVMPVASVTIRNLGTAQIQKLQTDDRGLFVSLPLYAGQYLVKVSTKGFKTSVRQVQLSVSQRIALEFKLAVGAITQTVNVRANPPSRKVHAFQFAEPEGH